MSVCTVYPKERSLSAMIFSIDTVSSGKEGRELPSVFLVPFSAYSRNRFNPATPIDEVRLRSIISDLKVEKIIISYRAPTSIDRRFAIRPLHLSPRTGNTCTGKWRTFVHQEPGECAGRRAGCHSFLCRLWSRFRRARQHEFRSVKPDRRRKATEWLGFGGTFLCHSNRRLLPFSLWIQCCPETGRSLVYCRNIPNCWRR